MNGARMAMACWLGVAGALAMGCGGDEGGGDEGASGSAGASGSGGVSGSGGASARQTNEPPTARGETYYLQPGQTLRVRLAELLANDVDPDGDTLDWRVTQQPAHASAALESDELVLTPEPGFEGEDSLLYSVTDAHGAADETDLHVYVSSKLRYVSPSGADTNTGTSPAQAWKTASKAVSSVCTDAGRAGTAVLFERGSVFQETLSFSCNQRGEPGKPIVFGAYGAGEAPVFTGSVRVSGWTKHQGSVWKATVPGEIKYLYYDGAWQTPARLPNTGWLRNGAEATPSAASKVSSVLLPNPGATAAELTGASLRIRTRNWGYEIAKITSYAGGRASLDVPLDGSLTFGGWGYYLDGRLAFLDAPGEWYADYDAQSGASTLYFSAPGSADGKPTGTVEAAVRDSAIVVYNGAGVRSAVVIDGLHGARAKRSAINLSYENRDVTVRRSIASDAYYGIAVWMDDVTIVESVIQRAYDAGGQLGGKGTRVLRSTVQDVALVPGYGQTGWGYFGLRFLGEGFVARHNVIDNIGYIALSGGKDGLIEENYVTRSNALLNDGGSIAFDDADGLIIRRNIVAEPIGTYQDSVSPTNNPWVAPYTRIVFGIYFGNTSIANTTVADNVVTGHDMGVFVDHTVNSSGNVVKNNLLAGNLEGQLHARDMTAGRCIPSYAQLFQGNVFVPLAPAQRLYSEFNVNCASPVHFGTLSQNLYATLYAGSIAVDRGSMVDGSVNRQFSLTAWQATGQDVGSTETPAELRLADTARPRLLVNPARGPRLVALTGSWARLDGAPVTEPITVAPYGGVVLVPR